MIMLVQFAALAAVVGAQPIPAESDGGPYGVIPDDYNPEEPPPVPGGAQTTVMASLVLKKLHDVDAGANIVTFTARIVQYWYDSRLSFDGNANSSNVSSQIMPGKTPPTKFVAVNPSSIWTPDIEVVEQVDQFQQSCNTPRAALFSDQFVANLPPQITKYNVFFASLCVLPIKCLLVLRDFPFDRNPCNLTLAPWLDRSYRLVPANQSHADLITQEFETLMNNHPVLETATTLLPGNKTIEYNTLVFGVSIARFSRYYIVNLIAPLLVIISLSWFAFFTPTNKGDRLGYSVTLLLSAMAVQFVTADERPPEAEDGWIDHFQVGIYIMIILPILETAVLYRIELTHERKGEEAEGYRKVHRLDLIARIMYPILMVLFIGIEMGPMSPVMREHHEKKSPVSPTLIIFVCFWVPIIGGLFACSVWNSCQLGRSHATESLEALHEVLLDPKADPAAEHELTSEISSGNSTPRQAREMGREESREMESWRGRGF